MPDILLNRSISYTGLGDRLDALCVAKILYDRDKKPVTLHMLKGRFQNFNELSSLYEMEAKMEYHGEDQLRFMNFLEHNNKGKEQIDLYNSVEDFPKVKFYDFNIDLPENFITVQFDSRQQRTRCSNKEVERIKDFYRNEGYELITIGGEATNVSLKGHTDCIPYMIYYMSKAKLHVGVDSGMMNLAKLVMPCENIHIYTSDVDPFRSSFLSRCVDKGTKVNYSRKNYD